MVKFDAVDNIELPVEFEEPLNDTEPLRYNDSFETSVFDQYDPQISGKSNCDFEYKGS